MSHMRPPTATLQSSKLITVSPARLCSLTHVVLPEAGGPQTRKTGIAELRRLLGIENPNLRKMLRERLAG